MELQFFCPRWGCETLSWEDFLTKVCRADYEGVEFAIPSSISSEELDQICDSVERYGLLMIGQHFDTYESNYERHFEIYQAWFEKIKPYPFLKINSQTGKDYFSADQNKALIAVAKNFSSQSGICVVHETHRNKFSFAAHVTRGYLEEIPDLQITFDVSHWVNVAESWLTDQADAIDIAIQRTRHIHARVGYTEGPQVPDPRVPEWQQALQAHLNWWDQVIFHRQSEGSPSLTITPEFGPYPYLVELPITRQPITNQWDVNQWMMRFLRERYQAGHTVTPGENVFPVHRK